MLAAAFSSVICRVTARVSSMSLGAEHPLAVLGEARHRGLARAADARRERGAEIEDRAPRDAALEALLERGGARRVVAAERQRHDADAVAVDVGARLEIVDRGGGRLLGVGAGVEVAQPQRLADARDGRRSAARCRAGEIPRRPSRRSISLVASKPSKCTMQGARPATGALTKIGRQRVRCRTAPRRARPARAAASGRARRPRCRACRRSAGADPCGSACARPSGSRARRACTCGRRTADGSPARRCRRAARPARRPSSSSRTRRSARPDRSSCAAISCSGRQASSISPIMPPRD